MAKRQAAKEPDRIDRAILALLQEDGRLPNADLARRVGLSATPCLERVRRLERLGYIQGYQALLDAERLGFELTVFMQLRLDHGGSSVFEAFNRAVENMPEIQEAHMVAGSFDYLLKIRLSSVAAYRQFMSERLPELPNVVQTQSHVVISAVKDSARLALGSAGDPHEPEDD